MADWIFCLVRTSSDVARRQEGISFVLVDMNTPGVSVKPIITIEGDREVNEVHFENVREWSKSISDDSVRWDGSLICSPAFNIEGIKLCPENGNCQFHLFAVHAELFNGL